MKGLWAAIGVNLVGVRGLACVRVEHLSTQGIISPGSLCPLATLRHPGLGGL